MRRYHPAAMRMNPNTHSYMLATAFMTSAAFAIFAMNVIALCLYYYGGYGS
jgi:hypothetical protein